MEQVRADVRISRDRKCMLATAALCVTVLAPLGIGYFAMSKILPFEPDPAVYDDGVRNGAMRSAHTILLEFCRFS